jgi:hypothetical protein
MVFSCFPLRSTTIGRVIIAAVIAVEAAFDWVSRLYFHQCCEKCFLNQLLFCYYFNPNFIIKLAIYFSEVFF